jgi:hypothetical protein
MKARRRADLLGVALQLGAAGELSVFELLDRGEMAVDQDRVGQRPQVLRRRQFRGIRRQEEHVDVVRHSQVDAGGFPAGPVQHQHNLLGGTGSHLAGELGSFHFKHRNADGGGQMEDGATRGRMDKADHESARRSGAGRWPRVAGPLGPRCGAAAVSSRCGARRWSDHKWQVLSDPPVPAHVELVAPPGAGTACRRADLALSFA